MNAFQDFWQRLGSAAKAGLMTGVVLILLATVAAGYWFLRTDYQVLFADLTQQDAGVIGAELERMKIPYSVTEQGNGNETILVERSDVYKTRIKLMGKEMPLHGAVGFELFNNSDFGMTEFAQKINYQRALQGELTRTIMSLAEVREARVLLAFPEQSLFKQAGSKTKASITLALKQGQALRSEQVGGIQRLVASAVPGIAAQDVTIVDQNGVALTRVSGDSESDTTSARLDLKKDTESYLTRKATAVLERSLGVGQALASVDVTLNMDRVQLTTEDVTPAPGKAGYAQAGVMVRERETLREVGAPLRAKNAVDVGTSAGGGASGGSSQREVEYAVGKRIEQVISQPGSIRRIHVVAVLKKTVDAALLEQIRNVVAASVGASVERGDTVMVESLRSAAPADSEQVATSMDRVKLSQLPVAPAAPATGIDALSAARILEWAKGGVGLLIVIALISLIALIALIALIGVVWRRARASGAASASAALATSSRIEPDLTTDLTTDQRQAALAQVRSWLHGSTRTQSHARAQGAVGETL